MAHLRAWLCFFVVFWWLWMLLVGEWNHIEWIAASGAAAIAATFGELARARARVDRGVSLRRIAELASVALVIFADFGLLVAALARRRRGTFQTRDSHHAETPGDRAWTSVVATYSPNAYVIELTADRVLLHRLIPWRRSEEPV